MPYIETVEHTTDTCDGKEYPVTIIRRRGLHTIKGPDGEDVLVDFVTITDSGVKLGVSHCFTPHRDYAPEQCEAGRKAILDTAARNMTEQGLW